MSDNLRQDAEALYERTVINTSGGSDWREVAMARIVAAFKAQRAAEVRAILDRYNSSGYRCNVLIEELMNWLIVRAKDLAP